MLFDPLAGRTIEAPGGSFVIVEWTAEPSPRWIAPLHVHHRDDEAWYVLEGTLGFRVGGEQLEAGAGSAVLAPAGTPHAYRNAGNTEARYLLVMTPRLHRLIEEVHVPGADWREIFRLYDSEVLE